MRVIFMLIGFLCLALGVIGVVLPILPTTPFLMAAAFFFAKSSEKLSNWFKQTKLYKKHLEGFVKKREMTVKTKLSILVPVSVLMAIGAACMRAVPVGQIILAVVWAGHMLYFIFRVKTIPENNNSSKEMSASENIIKE